jgi:hypothetical protein
MNPIIVDIYRRFSDFQIRRIATIAVSMEKKGSSAKISGAAVRQI